MGDSPTTSPIVANVEVFILSNSCTMTSAHPSYSRHLCPLSNPRNTQNQLGTLMEPRKSKRMHGAHVVAEFVVGMLHGAHDTYQAGLFFKTSV